jgi:hypothetical protein
MKYWLMIAVAGLLATPALAETVPSIATQAAIMARLKRDLMESIHHKPVYRQQHKEGSHT